MAEFILKTKKNITECLINEIDNNYLLRFKTNGTEAFREGFIEKRDFKQPL